MMLNTLASHLVDAEIVGDGQVDIQHITHDSRDVGPGTLFVALPGRQVDGQKFIPSALERGAVAVALPRNVQLDVGVPLLYLAAPRVDLAQLSAHLHGYPAKALTPIGITGTNGKTTTAAIVAGICDAAGQCTGQIGTNGHRVAGHHVKTSFTTPESPQLQALLSEMVGAGVDTVAIEVSSVGLEEHRVHAVPFQSAGFLNLTVDHLDYHGDMNAYGQAKLRLFIDHLALGGTAVIDVDDEFGRTLPECLNQKRPDLKVLTVSLDDGGADFYFQNLHASAKGISGQLVTPNGPIRVESPMLGRFNASNLAMGIALCQSVGVTNQSLTEGLKSVGVEGRMARIDVEAPFQVVVDYAHSPDALKRVLQTLRPLTEGHLWCVFGCGGDRDATKRAPMGAVSIAADIVMITSDNPRSEDPEVIAEETAVGALNAGFQRSEHPQAGHICVETDRAKAIRMALANARVGDVVLIAGKGHETYQEISGTRHPFDDAAIVRDFFSGDSV